MEIRQMKSFVRVNQISPGLVATNFQQNVSTDKQYLDDMTERHKTALTVPLRISDALISRRSERCHKHV